MDILENGQVDKFERLEFCLPEMKTDPNLRLKDKKCLGILSQWKFPQFLLQKRLFLFGPE